MGLSDCGAPMGTWTISEDGGQILVDLGYSLVWYIVTLDDTTLTFGEGGDQFRYERRTPCDEGVDTGAT